MSSQNNRAFAAGAERLEQVARSLKSRQIEEQQGTSFQVASSRMMAVSPDEMWARQFSSQCIGPVCFKTAPGSDMALPPLTHALQGFVPVRQGAASSPAAPVASKSFEKQVPMGAAIGKPVRRSLLQRMFSKA